MESKTLISQDSEIKALLLQRGENVGKVELRDSKRYYFLLNHHLLELSLTIDEANLICEALKDYQFEDDPEQARTLWKQVQSAIQQDQLDQKWSVNSKTFIRKLQVFVNFRV